MFLFQSPSIFPLTPPFVIAGIDALIYAVVMGERRKDMLFWGHVLSLALYELPRNEGNSLELVGCGEDYFAEGGVAVNA